MKHHKHTGPRAVHDLKAPKEFLGIPVEVDTESHFLADSRGVWPRKKIVLGVSYFYLSEREKEAVLCHEVAHCKRFHMEKRLLALPLLFMRPAFTSRMASNQELEADRFAAERGLGVELLQVIRKYPENQGQFHPNRTERVAALNKFLEASK
jgi:hypothetical protein